MELNDILNTYNFKINGTGEISKKFLERDITDFEEAAKFIRHLPFRRNANKNDLRTVFADGCGTCGTKHAILRQLALENSKDQFRLKIGIFKMNASNTPSVANVLKKYKLDHIPEAHCYLVVNGEILDCTKPNSKKENFVNDLLTEIEIEPGQITDYKVSHQKNFLKEWLKERNSSMTLDELWRIREECIANF